MKSICATIYLGCEGGNGAIERRSHPDMLRALTRKQERDPGPFAGFASQAADPAAAKGADRLLTSGGGNRPAVSERPPPNPGACRRYLGVRSVSAGRKIGSDAALKFRQGPPATSPIEEAARENDESARRACLGGASSRTRWAFVPPNPKRADARAPAGTRLRRPRASPPY